jgi:predicted TIM-barrel fold metal-dependent hydrolase
MSNRRDFLKGAAAAAGVVFTSCGILDQRMAAQPARTPKKQQPIVGGKRVKSVDVHAHVMIPEAMEMLGRKLEPGNDNVIAGATAEERFKIMDEWGIDMQALSINAIWYDAPRDVAEKVIELQNQKLAELVAKYPKRFVAYASVALQFPELAAQQMEDGMKKYGLRGAAIGGHVAGDELSNPKFDPFWKKAEELGGLVFMHPQGIPEINKRVAGHGGLTNVIGNPLETTIFLSHLIFDGTLDKFPNLKLCSAHAGGYLPSYIGRSNMACQHDPKTCRPDQKSASDYLKKLYFDSMIFTPENFRHLIAECGPSQIMLGTDYPFTWSATILNDVLTQPGLSDPHKRAIIGENAQRLLKISA